MAEINEYLAVEWGVDEDEVGPTSPRDQPRRLMW